MIKKIVALMLPAVFISAQISATMLIKLDTFGNSVGISDKAKTYYSTGSRLADPSITSENGKVLFKEFSQEEGSATGTPPHLMYSNYIGSYVVETQEAEMQIPENTMFGSKRRVVFCKGTSGCKLKKESKESDVLFNILKK